MRDQASTSESAKQRALRIPLDYYTRADRLRRWKWALSLAAIAAAGGYVAWLLLDGNAGGRHASPGPLAAVHVAPEHDCAACHASASPLRPDSADLWSLVASSTADERRQHVEQSCLVCHPAPAHHHNAKAEEVATCAACHREHRGRDADLLRISDAMCTACHADIAEHRVGTSKLTPATGNVTSFAGRNADGSPAHPEFRSLGHDPGNVKFNHWLHLQPGVAVADARQKLRLSDIDAADRSRYEPFAAADGTIALDCSACHQPQAAGATMRPIAYEQHCRACHPLHAALAGVDEPPAIPHGLSPAGMHAILDGLVLGAELRAPEAGENADDSGELPLVPGRTLGQNLAQRIGEDALVRRTNAAELLAARCQQCHFAREAPAGDAPFPELVATNIPERWLAHARFDHQAHRAHGCRTCHAAAYSFEQHDAPRMVAADGGALPAGYLAANDHEVVMIAGLETCVQCHAPRRGTAGGARHDCVQCHAYHGRERSTSVSLVPSMQDSRFASISSASKREAGSTRKEPRGGSSEFGPPFFTAALAEENSPATVGAMSCSAAGCHGDARTSLPAWRTALTTFLTRDPHVHAYDVLWTQRSREMTHLLATEASSDEPLDDDAHFQVIQERCIGCHATPQVGRASPTPGDRRWAKPTLLGVQCESCHGPAEDWLHAHHRTGFRRDAGFRDTKDLATRAAVCMPCHVGPNHATRQPQVVDHELIAAGHPRLAFEFRAYFESLPAHWDRERDEQRIDSSFHWQSWLAGQQQQATQTAELLRHYESRELPTPEFAMLDCFACHHALAADSWRQQAGSRPASELFSLRPLPAPIETFLQQPPPAAARQIVASVAAADQPTFDEATHAYLAARAAAADLSPPSRAALDDALHQLRRYLAIDCFPMDDPHRRPTQYDSPARYAPQPLTERLRPVTEALRQLEDSVPAGNSSP